MELFYHCSPVILSEGSVIEKGNWGRILRLYNRNGVGDQLMREYVLENIRKEQFPEKPSRLDAIFVCPTEQDARDYMQNTQKNTEVIYEVKVIDKSAALHYGDYGQVSPMENYLESIEPCAIQYWKGNNINLPEVLIGSNIQVVRRVS
jgi:hypothetical protein